MQQHQYPTFAAHKAEHDALTKQVLEVQKKLNGGATATDSGTSNCHGVPGQSDTTPPTVTLSSDKTDVTEGNGDTIRLTATASDSDAAAASTRATRAATALSRRSRDFSRR